jgi:hypothetical protein
MWAFEIVMLDILLNDIPDVLLAKQKHLVQAFVLDRPDESLGVSICLRRRLHPVRAMAMESFASSIPSIRAMASSLP